MSDALLVVVVLILVVLVVGALELMDPRRW